MTFITTYILMFLDVCEKIGWKSYNYTWTSKEKASSNLEETSKNVVTVLNEKIAMENTMKTKMTYMFVVSQT